MPFTIKLFNIFDNLIKNISVREKVEGKWCKGLGAQVLRVVPSRVGPLALSLTEGSFILTVIFIDNLLVSLLSVKNNPPVNQTILTVKSVHRYSVV